MANPLACAAGLASLKLLLGSPWQSEISRIEHQLRKGLEPCQQHNGVTNVRVLGAIGVVELVEPVDMAVIQPMLVDAGVWVRPFGRLVYVMPPFVTRPEEIATLTRAIQSVVL